MLQIMRYCCYGYFISGALHYGVLKISPSFTSLAPFYFFLCFHFFFFIEMLDSRKNHSTHTCILLVDIIIFNTKFLADEAIISPTF